MAWRPKHVRTIGIFAATGTLVGLAYGWLLGASTYFGLMGFASGSIMGAVYVAKIRR